VRTALVLGLVCILGCEDPVSQPGPRDVLETYLRALAAEDWDSVYELIASESREGRTRAQYAAWRSARSSSFSRALETRMRREVVSEQIEGDRAEIRLRVEMPDVFASVREGGQVPSEAQLASAPLRQVESRISLVREDGRWKVIPAGAPKVDRQRIEAELERATRELPAPALREAGSEP
jgi:hypothetical protein